MAMRIQSANPETADSTGPSAPSGIPQCPPLVLPRRSSRGGRGSCRRAPRPARAGGGRPATGREPAKSRTSKERSTMAAKGRTSNSVPRDPTWCFILQNVQMPVFATPMNRASKTNPGRGRARQGSAAAARSTSPVRCPRGHTGAWRGKQRKRTATTHNSVFFWFVYSVCFLRSPTGAGATSHWWGVDSKNICVEREGPREGSQTCRVGADASPRTGRPWDNPVP